MREEPHLIKMKNINGAHSITYRPISLIQSASGFHHFEWLYMKWYYYFTVNLGLGAEEKYFF